MATSYYVDSRNGNDSDAGTSWGAAKKTFGAMWAAAADTTTTEGSPNKMYLCGVFGEVMAFDATGLYNEFWEIHAQGFAIFDRGFGAGNTYGISAPLYWSGIIIKVYGCTFKGYTSQGLYGSSRYGPKIYDCVFDGQGVSPYGYKSMGSTDGTQFYRCTFKNHAQSGLYFQSDNPHYAMVKAWNCTIVGNTNGVELNTSGTGWAYWFDIQNCIFRTNTSHVNVTGADTTKTQIGGSNSVGPSSGGNILTLNNNNIDFSSGNAICFNNSDVKTTYTSLATWAVLQNHGSAVGSNNAPDSASISQDPKFIDEARELYGLAPDSGSLSAGAIGVGSVIQGAWEDYQMEGISATRNASLWTGATFSNCEIDSNNIVLSAGQNTGTATFVYDFGAQREIKRLDFSFLYGWDTSIFDYDTSDTEPETWSFRYRTSPDGTPTWSGYTTANWLSDLNLSSVYVLEIEVTLRNNV